MKLATIPKNRIRDVLGVILENYRLAAPVSEDGKLVFAEVSNPTDVVLGDEITYKSPKEFLFPQIEEIMVFDENGGVSSDYEVTDTVVFGVKPCDLEALKVMTDVFTKDRFKDTYFERRLNHTILVGMSCASEKPGCFCGERGISRHYSEACDMLLTEGGEHYTVRVFTEKGKELLEHLSEFITPVDEPEAERSTDGRALEIQGDENTLFNGIDWERISEKCLGCGTCTYICPTCHCFEFKDTVENGRPVRYRCWDSCMYPRFTLHASGHNPRPTKKERFRQRVMHKYLYVRKNFGHTACTGCGRCIRSCPAGMNIKSVVENINRTLSNAQA